MNKKMMITFSGIDSSGKTTQIDKLMALFNSKGINTKKIWGKGRGTPGVLLLKLIFRSDHKMNTEQKKEYRKKIYGNSFKKKLLLIASIIDLYWYFGLYYRILKLRYNYLICDRYIWDTYIDFKSEFPEYDIDKWLIWKFALCIVPSPTKSIVFYITGEESYKRDLIKGDLDLDSLEVKKIKADLYKKLIDCGTWRLTVDGTAPISEVYDFIVKELFYDNSRNV